jgi:hypothetical protein
VKEEIKNVAKEAGFQDISDNDVVEFLEWRSLPLTNEEMAGLDEQTYEEAHSDHDGECDFTLSVERFKRNLQQNE